MIIITINVGYILLTSLNASQIKVSSAVVNDFNQLKRSMCPAPAPPLPVVGQRKRVPRGRDVGACDQHQGQRGHVLEDPGVVPPMGHRVHSGLVVLMVLGEEKDVSIQRVYCQSLTVMCVIWILDLDVLNILGANHNVVSIPVLGHAWLLELVNCEGRPDKKDFDNSELEKKHLR